MTAAEHTRIILSEFKQVGTPFRQAWAYTMRTLPRKAPDYQEWKKILLWARPAFEAAYYNEPLEVIRPDDFTSVLMRQRTASSSTTLSILPSASSAASKESKREATSFSPRKTAAERIAAKVA